jgi:5-hydroxyisourate hydrolase
VSHHRPTISTHLLDTAAGTPRAGVTIRLRRPSPDGGAPLVGEGVTDVDGRILDLLAGGTLEAGAYRLEFVLSGGTFFTGLALDFRVDDAARSYHLPLLLAPFGLTAYLGS